MLTHLLAIDRFVHPMAMGILLGRQCCGKLFENAHWNPRASLAHSYIKRKEKKKERCRRRERWKTCKSLEIDWTANRYMQRIEKQQFAQWPQVRSSQICQLGLSFRFLSIWIIMSKNKQIKQYVEISRIDVAVCPNLYFFFNFHWYALTSSANSESKIAWLFDIISTFETHYIIIYVRNKNVDPSGRLCLSQIPISVYILYSNIGTYARIHSSHAHIVNEIECSLN